MYCELIKCLDTNTEKGIWENKQKTTNGFAKHEKVCFLDLFNKVLITEAFDKQE